jgi:hypothetical protein
MSLRKLAVLGCTIGAVSFGSGAMAQEQDGLSCDEIEWSSVVTDQYANIADACDAVTSKNDKLYARIEVEILRVRGRTMTFRILNNDGSSGGNYSQTVSTSWRASIGGRTFRPGELNRGQRLNVYMPSDRWAVIQPDADGPDDEDAVALEPAQVLPKTASPLPLIGLFGGMFLALGAGLGVIRRRFS